MALVCLGLMALTTVGQTSGEERNMEAGLAGRI